MPAIDSLMREHLFGVWVCRGGFASGHSRTIKDALLNTERFVLVPLFLVHLH